MTSRGSSHQSSSLSLCLVSIKRSSLLVPLLLALGVGFTLFYVFSGSNEQHKSWNRHNGNQAIHWSPRKVPKIVDKHGWTTTNCHKGMGMLIELCPCIGLIDTSQHVEKIEDDFVECVDKCANDNSTIDYDEKDLKGADLDEYIEDDEAPKGPAGKQEVKAKAEGATKSRRRRR